MIWERLRKRLRGLFRALRADAAKRYVERSDAAPNRECLISLNGRERIFFYRRSDGLWEFIVETFAVVDMPEENFYLEYWHPSGFSGLYDSLATARREAIDQHPWIKKECG